LKKEKFKKLLEIDSRFNIENEVRLYQSANVSNNLRPARGVNFKPPNAGSITGGKILLQKKKEA